MKIGVVFPQTEIGMAPDVIGQFAKSAEELGYDHILVYDHVLGAVPRGPDWQGYTREDMFHEPFVLLGYLAAVTRRIELATGILILPQRQTALVAKQAAEVDVLSGGRLRLGVGVGWNDVEYEALRQNFHTRGARIEEQVQVLRALWTQPVVTFEGRWHHIRQAGINPLPVQRPIPIWMGGESDAVLRRVARMADGWIPGGTLRTPTARHPQFPGGFTAMAARLKEYLREAGRPDTAVGLERRVAYSTGPERWMRVAEEWKTIGGTHFSVNTMQADLTSPAAHIDAMHRFMDTIAPVLRS